MFLCLGTTKNGAHAPPRPERPQNSICAAALQGLSDLLHLQNLQSYCVCESQKTNGLKQRACLQLSYGQFRQHLKAHSFCGLEITAHFDYTYGKLTSQYLRYVRHFVGITWHNVQLIGEDLPCYSTKMQPVSLRKCTRDH